MGHFVTGVTVVTTFDSVGRAAGITVNALSSVSLEPPLVVVALDRRRFITPMVHASGSFGVSILSEEQQALSDCFAGADVSPGTGRFLRCVVDAGDDRPADPRRRDRLARVHGHRDASRRRPRPVRRTGCGRRQRGASPPPTALLPPPLSPGRSGGDAPGRGPAGGLTGCRSSMPTASTSVTKSMAPGRRWSCSTARPRRVARILPPRCRCSRRPSRPSCPTLAVMPPHAGTRPRAGAMPSSWTTSRPSPTRSDSRRSTCSDSRWVR